MITPAFCLMSTCKHLQRGANGSLTVAEIAPALIRRIETREAVISAWCHFDRQSVVPKAKESDARAVSSGRMLNGLFVGVNDIL